MSFQPNASGLMRDEIRKYNSETMRLLSLYLNLSSDIITPEAVLEIAKDFGVTREYAYATILATVCGLKTAGKDRVYFENYFVPMVREVDPTPFVSDAYYKAIAPKPRSLGKWELRMQALKPCEAFVRDDFRVLPDGRMLPSIGFFMEEFPYPAVLEGGREWMTLLPNETVTILPAIARAHGRVVTFGLGLGYFAYHAAAKSNVESVTVIELSRDAATLFSENILPCIPHREKIRVVIADAFEYLESTMKDGDFAFAFADIWHDAGDGLPLYRRFKEYEGRFPSTEFTYWLEDTLLCYENKELWG